eukprot:2130913-Amphidinium_carterae.1
MSFQPSERRPVHSPKCGSLCSSYEPSGRGLCIQHAYLTASKRQGICCHLSFPGTYATTETGSQMSPSGPCAKLEWAS